MQLDPYAVLDVPTTATADEIRRAYLRDPERRARYDRARRSSAPRASTETINTPNRPGRARILGLTLRIRVKWLSG